MSINPMPRERKTRQQSQSWLAVGFVVGTPATDAIDDNRRSTGRKTSAA